MTTEMMAISAPITPPAIAPARPSPPPPPPASKMSKLNQSYRYCIVDERELKSLIRESYNPYHSHGSYTETRFKLQKYVHFWILIIQ